MSEQTERPRRDLQLLSLLARRAGASRARGPMAVWPVWERLARRFSPTMAIPDAPHGLVDLHVRRHRSGPVTLRDGSTVLPGDTVIELHVNNWKLSEGARASKWMLLKRTGEDFHALAAWLSGSQAPTEVRAVYGVTMITPAAARLGFMLRPRPVTIKTRLERFFMSGLFAVYGIEGADRLRQGHTIDGYPQEIWMSRAEFLARYGEKG